MRRTYDGDVVVIGGGLAGIVATLELADAGKKVVLLDRTTDERFGGLAKMSFGGLFFVASGLLVVLRWRVRERCQRLAVD